MMVVRICWQRDDVTADPCITLVFSWTSVTSFHPHTHPVKCLLSSMPVLSHV